MKLLFTISVAIVLRSNARNYCGTTDGELTDDCIDASGCQPYASKPTVCCAFETDGQECGSGDGQKSCVEYRNDGKHCKQEKVHPIPRCQDIYTQDDISHVEEKWFFCAAGSEDRSLDTATDVGKCMPPESVHGEVCVNWLQWAFMQAVEKPGGETCFVNGLESDKDCVEGIARYEDDTTWEVKVESGGSTFQVRCAESQNYDPQEFMSPPPTGSRPKACGNTFYLKLEDSRVNNFLDEYLYCAESAHQWRSTPYTGAPTNAPTHEPTQRPTNSPTYQPTEQKICVGEGEDDESVNCDSVDCENSESKALCGCTCPTDSDSSTCEGKDYRDFKCVYGGVVHEYCPKVMVNGHCGCDETLWSNQQYPSDSIEPWTYCCDYTVDSNGVADPRLGQGFHCDPYIAPPTCPTKLEVDNNGEHDSSDGAFARACASKCNVGKFWVWDLCQESDDCDCPNENAREAPCTGPNTQVQQTYDHGCSATCWDNGVNNSNLPSGVNAPEKRVDTWMTCNNEEVEGTFTTQEGIKCNTYSCDKKLAKDAGLAVNN